MIKRHAFKVLSSRNTSGTIGVFRTVRSGVPVWVAMWQDIEDGRHRRAQFSAQKWGEEGARKKAEDKRAEMEAHLVSALGEPGVAVQRCLSKKIDGWQVRWWEPSGSEWTRMSLMFSRARYAENAEQKAEAFPEILRRRLAPLWKNARYLTPGINAA